MSLVLRAAAIALAASLLALACASRGDSDAGPLRRGDDGGVAGAGDAGPAATSTAEAGLLPPGCFPGAPITNDQFLDACNVAAYETFDNKARLPFYNGATITRDDVTGPPTDAGL